MFKPFEMVLMALCVVACSGQAPTDDGGGPGGDGDGREPATGQPLAYVKGLSWDEIRLVEADGSDDRLLWTHGLDDPNDGFGYDVGVHNVLDLAWRPDGSELAFAATHERHCSLNDADLFAVSADGDAYRRITQAPSCAELAALPQGAVDVPVSNPTGSAFDIALYFQGAEAPVALDVPANSSAVVTFESVADLGPGVVQRAILISSLGRGYGEDAAVDVEAGATVSTPELTLQIPNNAGRPLSGLSWRSDGSALVHTFRYTDLYTIDAEPEPLDLGEPLLGSGLSPGTSGPVEQPAWGPPSHENEILYIGQDEVTNAGIYLLDADTESVGVEIIAGETVGWVSEEFLGLSWLPDGSGFLFSLLEAAPDDGAFATKSNVYEYTFSTGALSRLTDVETTEYAGRLSLSPDGTSIAFELSNRHPNFTTGELHDADVWIMNRDGSNLRLLVEDARAPAWRP